MPEKLGFAVSRNRQRGRRERTFSASIPLSGAARVPARSPFAVGHAWSGGPPQAGSSRTAAHATAAVPA